MLSLMESSRSSWRRPAYLAGVRKKREIGFWACLSRFPRAQNPLSLPFRTPATQPNCRRPEESLKYFKSGWCVILVVLVKCGHC